MEFKHLKGRDFLTLLDFTPNEIENLLDVSNHVKNEKKERIFPRRLYGKNIALIFEKPSTRTRCSFVVACNDEGAHPEYLGKNDIQMGAKESVADTARVLARIFDGIEFRGFSHKVVEELAEYSDVPVWNGLTDQFHPTQILADMLTIKENFGQLEGIPLVYIGDARNNVANSLMIGAAKLGLEMRIIAPKDLWPEDELVKQVEAIAAETKGTLALYDNPVEGMKGAKAVYTDVWVSMGEEDKPGIKERIASLEPYQVNAELMSHATDDAIFLHCLPAYRNKEVTDEVMDGKWSRVFDQAENRMHTIKAVMLTSLEGKV